MKVAVLTDTNSGISFSEAEKLGIYLMPMPILIGEDVFYEGDNITEAELYEALESGKDVSTTQPSPADVMDMWDGLLADGYDEVVYIPMSSGLSGSCMTAKGFARDYDGTVFVVDNHRISVTMRTSVEKAKKLADSGMTGGEILEYLEKDAYNSTIYVSVNTLEYLKKGGRVTPAAAAIGTMLNIKPVLSIQGEKLDSFAKVRGSMSKCIDKMIAALKHDLETRFPDAKPEQLHVGGAGAGLNQEQQDELMALLGEHFPGTHLYYDPLSASVAVHTGPGAVGMGISVDVDCVSNV